MHDSSFFPNSSIQRAIATLTTASIALLVTGCTNLLPNDYEAAAVATYVWQVEYSGQTDRPLDRRIDRFETTTLTNVDGIQPNGAVTGPDDQGLWWPALPPRPTVDDLEINQEDGETIGTPELIKQVDYTLSFYLDGGQQTLPANYSVYRQAVKAKRDQRPLELTLGPAEKSVTKAEIR